MSRTVKRWTPEEDALLLQQITLQSSEGKAKDWNSIATAIPGRSNKDCRKRWCNHLVGGLRKGPWDPSEDRRLSIGVKEYGSQWPLVAEEVGTRSADQCAKRWQHSLNPDLDHSKWTEEEEEKLLEAVSKHGRAWKQIQTQYFPGRATNNVKNRYVTLVRKRKPQTEDANDANVKIDIEDMSSDKMNSPSSSATTYSDNHRDSLVPVGEDQILLGNNDGGRQSADEQFSLNLSTNRITSSTGFDLTEANHFATGTHFDFTDSDYVFNVDVDSSSASALLAPDGEHRYPSTARSGDADPQAILTNLNSTHGGSDEFILAIKDPLPETITAIINILVSSQTKFRVEMK